MKLKWQQAPVKTTWGDEMVVASVEIDNDHTVDLYCERSQTAEVEAMFAPRQPLTDEELWGLWNANLEQPFPEFFVDFKRAAKVIEAAHGIKENT